MAMIGAPVEGTNTNVDRAENYFAPGTLADHPYGILYQGEFETVSDGTAQAVRLHARALAATGLPLQLRSFSSIVVNEYGVAEPVYAVGIPPEVEAEVGHLLKTSIGAFRPAIKHLVIPSAERMQRLLMPRGAIPEKADDLEAQIKMRNAIYDNTIVYSVWERDRVDPAIARTLARVKQCWVPSLQNARMLVQAGVPEDRVHIVPHPYTDDDMIHVCTNRPPGHFRDHGNWRRYYSIGRWEPRKGFVELIHAFLAAHKPDDKAKLTIKYSGSGVWEGYPSPATALAMALAGNTNGWTASNVQSRVKLIDGRIKRSMIVKLHWDNNIYVSSSHGEAWNLSAFDAKLAGNALVYVPYGGVCDFAESADIALPHTMGPAHPSYRWEHDAQWADYETRDLAEALTRAQVPDAFQRAPGFERFSMESVGKKMRDLVALAVPPGTLPGL